MTVDSHEPVVPGVSVPDEVLKGIVRSDKEFASQHISLLAAEIERLTAVRNHAIIEGADYHRDR